MAHGPQTSSLDQLCHAESANDDMTIIVRTQADQKVSQINKIVDRKYVILTAPLHKLRRQTQHFRRIGAATGDGRHQMVQRLVDQQVDRLRQGG